MQVLPGVVTALKVHARRHAGIGGVEVGQVQLPDPLLPAVVRSADVTVVEPLQGQVAEPLPWTTTADPGFHRPLPAARLQVQLRHRLVFGSGLRQRAPLLADVGVAVLAVSGLLRKPSVTARPQEPPVAADVRVGQRHSPVAADAFLEQPAVGALPVIEHHRVLVRVHDSQVLRKHPEEHLAAIGHPVRVRYLDRKLGASRLDRSPRQAPCPAVEAHACGEGARHVPLQWPGHVLRLQRGLIRRTDVGSWQGLGDHSAAPHREGKGMVVGRSVFVPRTDGHLTGLHRFRRRPANHAGVGVERQPRRQTAILHLPGDPCRQPRPCPAEPCTGSPIPLRAASGG